MLAAVPCLSSVPGSGPAAVPCEERRLPPASSSAQASAVPPTSPPGDALPAAPPHPPSNVSARAPCQKTGNFRHEPNADRPSASQDPCARVAIEREGEYEEDHQRGGPQGQANPWAVELTARIPLTGSPSCLAYFTGWESAHPGQRSWRRRAMSEQERWGATTGAGALPARPDPTWRRLLRLPPGRPAGTPVTPCLLLVTRETRSGLATASLRRGPAAASLGCRILHLRRQRLRQRRCWETLQMRDPSEWGMGRLTEQAASARRPG